MLKQKLLTITGVLGILACGACFLPTPSGHRPPLRPQLSGVRSIRVQVQDVSQAPHFDPTDFASALAEAINAQGHRTWAQAQADPGNEDAVLQIKVLKETAQQDPAHSTGTEEKWYFSVTITATLVRKSQVIWEDKNSMYSFNHRFPPEDFAAIWSEPSVTRWEQSTLAQAVAYNLLHPQ